MAATREVQHLDWLRFLVPGTDDHGASERSAAVVNGADRGFRTCVFLVDGGSSRQSSANGTEHGPDDPYPRAPYRMSADFPGSKRRCHDLVSLLADYVEHHLPPE